VQEARLITPGHSKSTVRVADVVAYFDSAYPNDPHASKTIGWRAEPIPGGDYLVILDYWNSGR